jgi:hypothetical protein
MNARTRCVWFTGAAVPVGALGGALLGAAIGRTSSNGFADLAGLVSGLMFGGPVLALVAFLATLPSVHVARPALAVTVMVGGVIVVTLLSVATLAFGTRLEVGGGAFVLLFLVSAAVAGGFAGLALKVADRSV